MADFIVPQEQISSARRGMMAGECQVDAGSADAAMPAGVLVCQGAKDRSVKLPAASGDLAQNKIRGIAIYLALREPYLTDTNEYHQYDTVNYVTRGDVYGIVEGAVSAGGQVFARITASGGNTQLGAFRADADTGNAVAVPNASFKSTTTGAGVARIGLLTP